MKDRIEEELELLRQFFPNLEYRREGRWVFLPRYAVPESPGWSTEEVTLAFQIPAAYPGQQPYGFHVSPPLTLTSGALPQNATLTTEPPAPGTWQKFSWSLPEWVPAAEVKKGSSMLSFALTFVDRLRQGA